MTVQRLDTKAVEKPWGRTDLPDIFPHPDGRKIGEIWFEGPAGQHPPLLVKYIFTSEKLSIQVHPTDVQARHRGLAGGKSECWYILDAEPDARLGIGTVRPLDQAELRASALDGSIEALMDWKPVKTGDFFYIPSGTIHAIGSGITLVEVQQNNDVTYRLYDYGRPRELHLADGVTVSDARPYALGATHAPYDPEQRLVTGGAAPFVLDRIMAESGERRISADRAWFIPLSGKGLIEGKPWSAGECWLVDKGGTISLEKEAIYLLATL